MKKSVFLLILIIACLLSGCGSPAGNGSSRIDDYMASVEKQAQSIRDSLERDAATQAEMNMKSKELCDLWDSALDYVWNELQRSLPEEEFANLQIEQRIWLAEKERAAEEAGAEFVGGSVYPLIVNSAAARMTEERVLTLCEILKQAD